MISFKATTLKAVAVGAGSLVLLLVVFVGDISVEAQQQMSDNDVYRMDELDEDAQEQDKLYYSRPNPSDGQSRLERKLLATRGSYDQQAEAQFEAMQREGYLRQLQEPHHEMGVSRVEVKKDDYEHDDLMLARDLSSHWLAAGMDEQEEREGESPLSQPVNDPEEFEARLGQLTDALNNNMPNTRTRQQLLLMNLMNISNQVDALDEHSPSPGVHFSSAHLLNELTRMVSSANSQDNADLETSGESSSTGGDQIGGGSGGRGASGGSEYIDWPLELTGQQYVQGGAGEGRQLLGPEGTFENVQVVKTDSAIPSYCDPPNPCPIGYTTNDGCLEEFVNLASFSREYQAKQKCSCDNEHSLFNCASPGLPTTNEHLTNSLGHQRNVPDLTERQDDSEQEDRLFHSATADKLDTLARTIQNRFGNLASVQRLIGKQQELHEKQHQEALSLAGNDDENSDYLVRSARKLSSLDMHHKVDLD